MKIYFAGSIRGGRQKQKIYAEIIKILSRFGKVLTEHVGRNDLSDTGEKGLMSDEAIYERDIDWLDGADLLVADVSVPSIGVGFELGRAVADKKKVLCLYDIMFEKEISPMVSGCSDIRVIKYSNLGILEKLLIEYFKSYSNDP